MPFCFPPIWVSWVSKILGIGKRHHMSHITIRAEQKADARVKSHRGASENWQKLPRPLLTTCKLRPAQACHWVVHPQEHQAAAPRIKFLEVLPSVCFLKMSVDQTNPGVSCSLHLEVNFQASGSLRGEQSAGWSKGRVLLGHIRPEFTSCDLLHSFLDGTIGIFAKQEVMDWTILRF